MLGSWDRARVKYYVSHTSVCTVRLFLPVLVTYHFFPLFHCYVFGIPIHKLRCLVVSLPDSKAAVANCECNSILSNTSRHSSYIAFVKKHSSTIPTPQKSFFCQNKGYKYHYWATNQLLKHKKHYCQNQNEVKLFSLFFRLLNVKVAVRVHLLTNDRFQARPYRSLSLFS